MKAYLKLDPQYVALFSDVWLWKDWPEREALGYKAPDTGIDLVAKLREEEGYCAIQCKFYDAPIPLGDLGSFFTLSGKGGCLRKNLGITVLPATYLNDVDMRGLVSIPLTPVSSRTIGTCRLRTRKLSPAAQKFWDMLHAQR